MSDVTDIPQEIAEKLARWEWSIKTLHDPRDQSSWQEVFAENDWWVARFKTGSMIQISHGARRKVFIGPRVADLYREVVERDCEPRWEDMP